MPDYSKGKVYEIICRITSERYIGSTIDTLSRRLTSHRLLSNPCISKNIIIRGDYYINLLEECDCENKMQLLKKEREWYDKLECINLNRPITFKEERKEYFKKYFKENKEYKEKKKEQSKEYYEKNKEKKKEYYEKNKDKIKEDNKKYYEKNKVNSI